MSSGATSTRSRPPAWSCSSIATRAQPELRAQSAGARGRDGRSPRHGRCSATSSPSATSDGRVALLQVRFLPVSRGRRVSRREGRRARARRRRARSERPRSAERVSYLEEGDRKFVAGQVADERGQRCGGRRERSGAPGARRRCRTADGHGRPRRPHRHRHRRHGHAARSTTGSSANRPRSPTCHRQRLAGHRARVHDRQQHVHRRHAPTARVSAWFRAPVGADGDLAHGAGAGVRAARRGRHGDRHVDPRPDVCDRRRRRPDRAAAPDIRPDARDAAGHGAVSAARPDAQERRAARGAAGRRRSIASRSQPASRRSSWQTLFGKVWYEGYAQPEYVWQSTGATDDFEPKFSLVPLVFGTIKGTFYALLFAIPLAVFGALYTSQFVHPTIRARIKPTIEIMAALPSVVIGFVAGLYLAPVVERNLVGVMLLVVAPAALRHLGLSRLERPAARGCGAAAQVGSRAASSSCRCCCSAPGWRSRWRRRSRSRCSAATRGSGCRRRSA